MKQFFKWIGKHIAGALVFSLFSILFIAGIVFALTYPSAPPTGEVAGGKFMQYFNKMLVNTGVTTDGTVHKSLTTSQIGALTEGKWCKVVGGKVDCTMDSPGIGGLTTGDITCNASNEGKKAVGLISVCTQGGTVETGAGCQGYSLFPKTCTCISGVWQVTVTTILSGFTYSYLSPCQ